MNKLVIKYVKIIFWNKIFITRSYQLYKSNNFYISKKEKLKITSKAIKLMKKVQKLMLISNKIY